MDFTDSSKPKEIAFFDRGPIDEDFLNHREVIGLLITTMVTFTGQK